MAEVPEKATELALARFQELRRRVEQEPHSPEPTEAEWIADLLEVAAPAIRAEMGSRDLDFVPGVFRCPIHGLVEPLRVTPSYGTGDPDEWGTCPLNLYEEGEVCGERMTPVDIYEKKAQPDSNNREEAGG